MFRNVWRCRHGNLGLGKKRFTGLVLGVTTALLVLLLAILPVQAAKSCFSKAHYIETTTGLPLVAQAAGDSGAAVFDVVISLHNDPSGDDDPNNDTGSEGQTAYENIIRRWADAVCEQSNGAHKLGKVRIFCNGRQSDRADVVWNASEWPRANISGFGTDGLRIMFGDVFPDGCGTGCNKNMLTDPEGAGYTLGHEWGHYVYGVYDEYKGKSATGRISSPRSGDTPVTPAIMHSQWKARGGNFEWLNHSTSNNYQANTAQGRVYGASCWEVLVRERSQDPRDGDRAALPQRIHYTALDGNQPTAADTWVKKQLPGNQATCRNQLEIIWMQDDIEMQVVIDRSGSMGGSAITNAKQAAKTLVDVVEDGNTALGVVSFSYSTSVTQDQAITAIPDPGDAIKATIKGVIDSISASGNTAMFDAAGLALTNLQAYQAANTTSASQAVFLLSDGGDNDSRVEGESSVTTRYQAADVPLITFGYGSYAPSGVLRRLADNTGGAFFASPTTLVEIQNAFLAANTAVSAAAGVASSSFSAPGAGGAGSESFVIDSTLESFTIVASYSGAPGNVAFTLVGPAGTVSGVSFDCTAVGSETSCIAQVDAATVTTQGFGTWSVEAASTTGSDVEVNLNVVAVPATGRTFDVTVASLVGSTVNYPEPIVVTATVSQGLPITGVNLTAIGTDPTGASVTIDMNDEGRDGDAVAGDGIYSAILGYDMDGTHTLKITVDNNAGVARFTTESFQPAHPSPDEDGRMPEAPSLPSITQNFTRTATAHVTVQGFQADDHSNMPPGTAMNADNSDVVGRIDSAGDVDYFQIN